MADWTITPEHVRAPLGAPILTSLAAANIGPGNGVWQVNANYIAQTNSLNANAARLIGITVGQAFTGQPLPYVSAGTLPNFGNAGLVAGQPLVVSPNAGQFCNLADLTANNYVTHLGHANNASTVSLSIEVTGLQVP